MKIKTGDVFIMWRMKQLISEGKIEVMGDMNKGWKEFDVKLPEQSRRNQKHAEEATRLSA